MICHSNSTDKPIYTLESRNISKNILLPNSFIKQMKNFEITFNFPKLTYIN